ncbi:MAG: hypothetical protein GWN62_24340 [Aliifodinibius sp.]|nr:hypothetical protein [Fodinibius sp.]
MHSINIETDCGNSWGTNINGTKASVVEYYFSNQFNIGRESDHMVWVYRVTFDDGTQVCRCPNPAAFELIRPGSEKVYDSFVEILELLEE